MDGIMGKGLAWFGLFPLAYAARAGVFSYQYFGVNDFESSTGMDLPSSAIGSCIDRPHVYIACVYYLRGTSEYDFNLPVARYWRRMQDLKRMKYYSVTSS